MTRHLAALRESVTAAAHQRLVESHHTDAQRPLEGGDGRGTEGEGGGGRGRGEARGGREGATKRKKGADSVSPLHFPFGRDKKKNTWAELA